LEFCPSGAMAAQPIC